MDMAIDRTSPAGGIVHLRNVTALATLIRRVDERGEGLPGLGVFSGHAGYGKSTACTWAVTHMNAVWVEIGDSWTRKTLCDRILFDLGIKPARTVADMVLQITEALAASGRTLLIDEAHDAARRGMLEIVREIHDKSLSPVILVGEEVLPQTLRKWERVHSRVLDWVQAEPASLRDVIQLAEVYAPGVVLSDALKRKLTVVAAGSLRRVRVNLDRIHEQARVRGRDHMDVGDCDPAKFFTGQPPAVRRQPAPAEVRPPEPAPVRPVARRAV
jgi:DNA transposition AAA+ family ATPase